MSDQWLEGVRVVDLTRLAPGPFCTLLLAELGADVIKIEDPIGGDYARYYPPMTGEYGALFSALNRDKRSVALNLKAPEGVATLRRLLEGADVLLSSFRPGVMARLGLGWGDLAAAFPRLIVCEITGYGQTGPLQARAGHDMNYMALSGLLHQTARPDTGPVLPGFQLADLSGALYAALGITGALYARERTGRGRFLDISMTDCALSFHTFLHGMIRAGDPAAPGDSTLTGAHPCYAIYETGDGRHLAVGALEPKFWAAFCAAIDLPELAAEGLTTGDEAAAVRAQVAARLRTRTLAEWTEVFADVDACCEPILTPQEALDHELFRARDLFMSLQGVSYTRTPLHITRDAHTPAPALGQHTAEVLGEVGVTADELEALKQAGAVA